MVLFEKSVLLWSSLKFQITFWDNTSILINFWGVAAFKKKHSFPVETCQVKEHHKPCWFNYIAKFIRSMHQTRLITNLFDMSIQEKLGEL